MKDNKERERKRAGAIQHTTLHQCNVKWRRLKLRKSHTMLVMMVMFLGINSQKSQGERVMVAAAAASE